MSDKRNSIPDAMFEPMLYDDTLYQWQSPDLADWFDGILKLRSYKLGNARHADLLRAAADAIKAADVELRA